MTVHPLTWYLVLTLMLSVFLLNFLIKLSNSMPKLLCLGLLQIAQLFVDSENFDSAKKVLNNIKSTQTNQSQYFYLNAIVEHQLNNKESAAKNANYYLALNEEQTVLRHKELMHLILEDVKTWKQKGEGYISRDMRQVANKLEFKKHGKPTQDIEQKIVKNLDDLIKEAEEQLKKAEEAASAAQAKAQKGQIKAPLTSNNPTARNDGPGNVDATILNKAAEKWGSLPQKEREKALAEMTKDLPPRLREEVENYFRALAKKSN